MCGIFGVITNDKTSILDAQLSELVKELFLFSELRGMESSGIVVKNQSTQTISTLRQSTKGSSFIKTDAYKKLLQSFEGAKRPEGLTLLGHTRIATNGYLTLDNQPIVKNGCFGIHNGIICNIEPLWDKYKELDRKQVIDTELLFGLLKKNLDETKGANVYDSLTKVFDEIEGTASIGTLYSNYNSVLIASNCGSLYYFQAKGFFIFASEEFILKSALTKSNIAYNEKDIKQLSPISFGIVHEKSLEFILMKEVTPAMHAMVPSEKEFTHIELTTDKPKLPFINIQTEEEIRSALYYAPEKWAKIKRCTKCILPETHPNIDFDEHGVCNYCRHYSTRKKKTLWGKEKFEKEFAEIKKKEGINCIVMLSGGRDSCYALHLVKKVFGLNPVAYSYDWGMLTDLGRRNQVRMCAKLGVEHIIVSADISYKRKNIRKNVQAFLHQPHLGIIGLFMAGDKAVNHYAADLSKKMNLPLLGGSCPMEWTYFKEGFSNVKPNFAKRTWSDRFSLINFFVSQSFKNPKLLNSSILDTLKAYKYYYLEALNVSNVFRYVPWEENEVNRVLVNEYNWELSPDTVTSWRIGDGTAAFYNYIYSTVAGFTENDCLRSNQVLEGIMTREEALEKALIENKPRYDSLRWYCDTIGIDLLDAIKTINNIPKLY